MIDDLQTPAENYDETGSSIHLRARLVSASLFSFSNGSRRTENKEIIFFLNRRYYRGEAEKKGQINEPEAGQRPSKEPPAVGPMDLRRLQKKTGNAAIKQLDLTIKVFEDISLCLFSIKFLEDPTKREVFMKMVLERRFRYLRFHFENHKA
ncbi:hypothetical protein M5K25_017963 [Dendrobium thyrsiflorum]|uniref:Uncharacterized protein n=1 Tax=Dendrobium thyrsiflorum TaxID=117978 RepID=A0ABD0UH87_DENTH